MGPGILPETTVGKHNPPCHLQMPTKTLSCKKEAICEHGLLNTCPVGQGSFKTDCFKVEKCSTARRVQVLHFLLEITDAVSSGLKRRERPSSMLSAFSSKAIISDGMGVHMCIRYGKLACLGRHYECWNVYIKVLEQQILPSRRHLFQQDQILQLLQQHTLIKMKVLHKAIENL